MFLPGDYVARKGEVATSFLGDHDGTGWMGVMGPMVVVRIQDTHDNHDYQVPFLKWMLQYFYPRCDLVS